MTYNGCNRCLINVNATSIVRAKWKSEDGVMHYVTALYPTDPKYLSEWFHEMVIESKSVVTFDINQMSGAFIPITSWNGDRVCVIHLRELRDKELHKR